MPGTFDTGAELLSTVKRTIELPHFSFGQLKNSAEDEVLFGNYEKSAFASEGIPSIIGFQDIPDGN